MISTKNYERLIKNLQSIDCFLETNYSEIKTTKDKVVVTNGEYYQVIKIDNYIYRRPMGQPEWFNVKNPFIIKNINKYLEINKKDNFVCESTLNDIITRDSILKFKCTRCGTIIEKSLFNLMRNDENHNGITCPNCDELLESIHAIVLKQMFVHFFPDTVLEDPSCINPNTGRIMKTDIVNHNLLIAVEVQGQYHKREEQKKRDIIKKEFWINKGYKFYDYDIDNVSVLDYIRLFFPNITEIPKWINMNYNKKLNLVLIQDMLNDGKKISEISKELNIKAHRIYDAISDNKLYYPDFYIKSNRRPVVMLSKNKEYICEYNSYSEAENANNITKGLIASCVYNKTYFASGYIWIPKDIYNECM